MKFFAVIALAALGAALPMGPNAGTNLPGSQGWEEGHSLITIGGSSSAQSSSGDTSSASTSSCGLLSCASSSGTSGPDSSSSSASSSGGDLSIDTIINTILGDDNAASGAISSTNGAGGV